MLHEPPYYGPSDRDWMQAEESVEDYYIDNPEARGQWDEEELISFLAERIWENRGKE